MLLLSQAQNSPDPTSLLQGVESIRLQVPPSSLKIRTFYKDALITNETICWVDFDGNSRGFTTLSNTAVHGKDYETVFDGERTICNDMSANQVTYRNIHDQLPIKLFDPRVIGLSTYNHWIDGVANTLPYRGEHRKIDLIGREEVGNLRAWHVRLTILDASWNSVWDYWIDDAEGFRVYRTDFNGVETYSYYENTNYPWLPSRVLGREYDQSRNGTRVLTAQRGMQILEARANVKLPKSRWTLAAMKIKPGTEVIDVDIHKVIGTWNGTRLVQDIGEPIRKPRGRRGYFLCILFLLSSPIVFLWFFRRAPRNP